MDILRNEIREIKYYMYELKNNLEIQNKQIQNLDQEIKNLHQTIKKHQDVIKKQENEIKYLIMKYQHQESEFKNIKDSFEQLKNETQNNMTKFVQESELLAFFQSLDPNRTSDLWYLGRNYAYWIQH
jgi:chromosome segregation ATPase